MKILMVAAENDALPGGKVGGIGDVVRDVPPALAKRDCAVTVVTPAYGVFSHLPDAQRLTMLEVGFGGMSEYVDVYQVPGRQANPDVQHVVLDHPLFAIGGPGSIYCDDPPEAPFATDANKFALFCLAVCEGLVAGCVWPSRRDPLTRLACDPGAGPAPLPSGLSACYKRFHCAYTIHNLALQGIRPV